MFDSQCPHQICGFIHVPFTKLFKIPLKSYTDQLHNASDERALSDKKITWKHQSVNFDSVALCYIS